MADAELLPADLVYAHTPPIKPWPALTLQSVDHLLTRLGYAEAPLTHLTADEVDTHVQYDTHRHVGTSRGFDVRQSVQILLGRMFSDKTRSGRCGIAMRQLLRCYFYPAEPILLDYTTGDPMGTVPIIDFIRCTVHVINTLCPTERAHIDAFMQHQRTTCNARSSGVMWALVSLNRVYTVASSCGHVEIPSWPVPADLSTMSHSAMLQWCYHPFMRLTMPFLVSSWPLGGVSCRYAPSFVRLFVILLTATWSVNELVAVSSSTQISSMLEACAGDTNNVYAARAYGILVKALAAAIS